MIIVFAYSPLTLRGIQRESSTAALQIKRHSINGFFNDYTSILQCVKTWMNGFTTNNTVVWNNDRFESLGLVGHFYVTFRPDPSSVLVVIVLADMTTRRQPHSVALFVHRATEESKVMMRND